MSITNTGESNTWILIWVIISILIVVILYFIIKSYKNSTDGRLAIQYGGLRHIHTPQIVHDIFG